MRLSRTKNTIRNTRWGVLYRIITLLGPFVVRTLIVNILGIEYSGLSSLFTSILTVLNLSNLGFSSSIVFSMYKAIADDDIDQQCAMINYFSKVYKIIGVVILMLGLITMPFLPYLVDGECPADINLYMLFSIYLFETVLDYFMFAYTTAIFTSYQRNDMTLKISSIRYIVQYALQALVLVTLHNYYAYIIVLPIMVIPNNIANYILSKKMFPFIECKGTLDKDTKHNIYIRVATLFGHKVGSTVLVGIDSIIISAFLGLTTMGLYGNYYYILTGVNAIIEVVTNGVLSGIGNKLVTDSKEDNLKLFNTLTYGWLFIVGIAADYMLCLYQPFIGAIWYDKSYLLEFSTVVLIVVYFYSWMFRIMQLTYRDAAGLWTKDWLKPYIAMVLNIIGSIVMVVKTGSLIGVLIPTILVFFFIYYPWEAIVIFKYLFKVSPKEYIKKCIWYTLLSFIICSITYVICLVIVPQISVIAFFVRFFLVSFTFVSLWVVVTFKNESFKALISIIKNIVKKGN